ncbi:MAG: tetratricopeptide repeat protein [Phycisphaerales bacterium]|nr:tetratricopeptide repeat protein [Phycisphaerales bacterium]
MAMPCERKKFSAVWGAVCAAVWLVGVGVAAARPAPVMDDDPTYRTATGLLNRGMHEAAAEEYREFLKERPGDARAVTARYGLAVCLSRMGRGAEAAAELDRVLKEEGFEFRADALLLRGRCHLEAGEYESAAARLKELREEFPDSARAGAAAGLEGEAMFRAGRYAQARPVLERAVELAGDAGARVRAGYFLALTDAATERTREAAERLKSLGAGADAEWSGRIALAEGQCRQRLGEARAAAELYGKAAASADAGIRRPALLGLGQVLRRSGDVEGASEALERVLKEGESAEAGPARLELARCWLDAARPEKAMELLRDGEVEGVGADEAAYWTARAEAAAGKHAEAAERLGAALKAGPKSALAANMLYDRAAALSRAGESGAALRVFEEFGKRYPGHELAGDAALARASLLHSAGEYAESAAVCAGLVEDEDEGRAATARLLLAESEYLAGRYAEAEKAYSAFLEDHGGDARAWRASVRRGLALARLERSAEAGRALESALKAAPASADAGLMSAACAAMGDLAFAAEEWAEAEAWYVKAALPDGKESAGAMLKLGLSVHRQGRPGEAVAVYERVMKSAGSVEGAGLHAAFERGQALAELGRLEEARAALEAVVKAEARAERPRFTGHALRQLASIASREGRAEEAAELLGKVAGTSGAGGAEAAVERGAALLAAGKAAEAEAALRGFLKEHGGHELAARARAQLAVAVSRQERYEEALGLIGSAEREGVEDGARPALMYEKAWALKSLGRGEEAASAYRDVLESAPPLSLEAHCALDLAQLEAAGGRCEEAIGWLDRAAKAMERIAVKERAGMEGSIAYLRGVCAYKLGRWEEAAKVLGAFADERPGDALAGSAALLTGESLLKAGTSRGAVERLRGAAGAGDAKVRGPALLRLGEALAAEERWLESEEALLGYLKEFGGVELWFQARFGVGWAREQQGKQEGAVEAYREVAERHRGPTAARAQFQIGECLFALKRYDEAVKELLKVDILFAYPEWSAAALYEAGRCLEESGKAGEAKKQFGAVVERFGESEWAGPAKERLRGLEPAALPGRDVKGGKAAANESRRTGR